MRKLMNRLVFSEDEKSTGRMMENETIIDGDQVTEGHAI